MCHQTLVCGTVRFRMSRNNILGNGCGSLQRIPSSRPAICRPAGVCLWAYSRPTRNIQRLAAFPNRNRSKRQHQLSRRDLSARAASSDPGGPYSIYCIEPGVTPLALLVFLWPMPKRLEDRIKDLCAKAVGTPTSPQLDEVLQQLQSALSEHTQRIRKMVAAYPARPARRSDDRN
jgi:hypothetical protein